MPPAEKPAASPEALASAREGVLRAEAALKIAKTDTDKAQAAADLKAAQEALAKLGG